MLKKRLFIVAILVESKLLDNKEQSRIEMHYDFDQEDITKDIDSYFTIVMSMTMKRTMGLCLCSTMTKSRIF